MPRILAIDYGAKRTGIAWTDPLQIIATGVGSFPTPEIEAKLREWVATEDIELFVLGYPSRADGSDTHATPLVREFKVSLEKWFPDIPVTYWDERGSSRDAMQGMINAGVRKKKRGDKNLINQVAATLILQDYMREEG
jgi:putative Holliday junction resolvase